MAKYFYVLDKSMLSDYIIILNYLYTELMIPY